MTPHFKNSGTTRGDLERARKTQKHTLHRTRLLRHKRKSRQKYRVVASRGSNQPKRRGEAKPPRQKRRARRQVTQGKLSRGGEKGARLGAHRDSNQPPNRKRANVHTPRTLKCCSRSSRKTQGRWRKRVMVTRRNPSLQRHNRCFVWEICLCKWRGQARGF